jgi:F-type H+-transporting ATPase subunit b
MQRSQLSKKIVSSVLAFAFVVGFAVSSSRAAAQQQAPAAQPAAAEQAKPAGNSEAKPTQEEQEHGFLVNGPIVKWVAKSTGMSADLTATIFLFINFAIIFFGVAIPIGRILPKIMRKRSQTLGHSLAEARKATTDADARLSAVEAKLAGLDEEIARFRAQVEEESKSDEARIKASIEEEKERIVASAEQELNAAAAHAQRSLRNFAADLAIEQAAKQMVLTPEIDRALIAEFVGNAAEGGKN